MAASTLSIDTDLAPYKWVLHNMDTIQARYPALITWKKFIPEHELKDLLAPGFPDRVSGISPDGGIFFLDGLPLLAIESKSQGRAGNAIERWFKNAGIMRRLGCLRYMTICTGSGFYDDNSAERIMGTASMLFDSQQTWFDDSNYLGNYRYASEDEMSASLGNDILHELDLAYELATS